MGRLSGRRVVVAGSGAVGQVLALRLRDEGAEVLLADPAPLGANASGVAAGMLAPAFEAALDPLAAGHFELLKTARDLWPELAARLARSGAALDRSGAMWVGDEPGNAAMAALLSALGAMVETLDAAAGTRMCPGLEAPAGAVFTPEDWALDPGIMLAALREDFEGAAGVVRQAAVRFWNGSAAGLSDGASAPADVLVLAAGLAADGLGQPPAELQRLEPIKGQIIRIETAAPRAGPVVRGKGVYVVPRRSGPIVGATMEAGVRDLAVDPAAVGRLQAAAARLFPDLAEAPARGAAGIRAATPDGLPLAGPSRTPGVWLAMGARRNGWLLAPLIAEVIAGRLAGGDGGPWAGLVDPARFKVD